MNGDPELLKTKTKDDEFITLKDKTVKRDYGKNLKILNFIKNISKINMETKTRKNYTLSIWRIQQVYQG